MKTICQKLQFSPILCMLICGLFLSSTLNGQQKKKERILLVVSSHDKKAEPYTVAGFWFPELSHPAKVFDDAGYEIDIASPRGGLSPFDGFDLKDNNTAWFWTTPMLRNKLGNSIMLSKVDASSYKAIVLVGGHGPMYDFVDNKILQSIIQTIYGNNGIVSAVCHGSAGLINVKLDDGKYLITGKQITAFTNEEEQLRQARKYVPFDLETKLIEKGAIFQKAKKPFESQVITDGRLVTGQNPASAYEFGLEVINSIQKIKVQD